MMNHLILEYQEASNERKKGMVEQYMLWLEGDDFEIFLNVVFLNSKPEVKKHAVGLLVSQPTFVLPAIKHLLATQEEDDSLNTLKYYGGRIAEASGQNIDYKTCVPLLVAAYKFGDYRDANWSIAMALSKITKDNPEAVTLIAQTSKAKLDTNALASLFSYLESYTCIDFHEYLR